MQGLSASDVEKSRRENGVNEIPGPRRPSRLSLLVRQFTHFFALLLWGAAGLAWLADLPELSVAIIVVIVFNGVFAFIQEERSNRATARLTTLLPSRVTVMREGRLQWITTAEVVLGDTIVLEAGDAVPADCRAGEATRLSVDTSILTGETRPVRVAAGEEIYAGCFVIEGHAIATVVGIGTHTRLAGIERLAGTSSRPRSPLTRELTATVRVIAGIAISCGLVFLIANFLLGRSIQDGVILAIGVTVALVPEALLPTVTLTLAWSAERMAGKQALVRTLDAVETLGATTFICTDKTGTLTMNQMTVIEAWAPGASAHSEVAGYEPSASVVCTGDRTAIDTLALAARVCSDGYVFEEKGVWVAHGDPMEAAIDVFARRLAVADPVPSLGAVLNRFPFDPVRRRMSVMTRSGLVVKGAPDSVLGLCGEIGDAERVMNNLTERGLRVIAVARREGIRAEGQSGDPIDLERELTLLGLLGFEDPPRSDVRDVLESCRAAGIAVAMITGDHPVTAASIADHIGLRTPDDPVIVGEDLPRDDRELGELVDHPGIVLARITPEDKLRVARVLRLRGHVVAMTGDGVNDVPALHEANIGIAMGRSGSDITREVADLILLDDHFGSIVTGIEQGRATYVNIRRFLTYHLTDNVAELTPFVIWAVSGGTFPLALGILQILALDIATDTFSAVALGAEPPSRSLRNSTPATGRLLDRTVITRAFLIVGPVIAMMTMAAFLASYAAAGWRVGQPFPGGQVAIAASGAAFITVVLAQVANAFACRSSSQRPDQLGWFGNRLLLAAVGVDVIVALILVAWPPIALVLGQAPPPMLGWMVAVTSMAAVFVVDAAYKGARARRRHAEWVSSAP
jgi:calcium-translocating P-type ATPase